MSIIIIFLGIYSFIINDLAEREVDTFKNATQKLIITNE